MINLWQLYQYLRFISNQSQLGFKLTPTNFNINLKFANFEYFKKEYGLTEDFKVGMPFSPKAFELTQQIKDKLSRFLVIMGDTNMPMVVDSTGHAPLPDDYLHVTSIAKFSYNNAANCTVSEEGRIIEPMPDNKFRNRQFSSIIDVSKYPICRFMDSYVQFAPKNIGQVEFVYLRKPVEPTFAWTTGTNNTIVPDYANMVEMEWDENGYIDIANIILSKIGITNQRADLTQYAEIIKNKGV